MAENWSLFEGEPFGYRARREARVTLGSKKHVLHINAVAYEALGSPQAVELLYEGNKRLIGVRAADAKKKNAFKVASYTPNGYRSIRAAAFCQNYRIRMDRTVQFEKVDFDADGMMLLDLNRVTEVGRGAR